MKMGRNTSMKKFAMLGLATLILAAGLFVRSSDASASGIGQDVIYKSKIFGPEVPLPLGSAMPFPYKEIDGFWKVSETKDTDRDFIMKAYKSKQGDRLVKVIEFDPNSGAEIARGLAMPVAPGAKVVRAEMLGKSSQYELFMGVYPDADSDTDPKKTVFAVRSTGFDSRPAIMVARKIGALK
jgi:hypothetical protein